ncbi:MAG: hypothetical protein RJA36_3354 [Pseudomonadota bacterium]|jgi:hypothetical protein
MKDYNACSSVYSRRNADKLTGQPEAALSDKVGPIFMAAVAACITLLELFSDRMA